MSSLIFDGSKNPSEDIPNLLFFITRSLEQESSCSRAESSTDRDVRTSTLEMHLWWATWAKERIGMTIRGGENKGYLLRESTAKQQAERDFD